MGANHAITEPATWDAAAPVVPDSDADMDDAPAVIEAFVTKLGKRTQWLYAAIAALPNFSLYGRKDTTNTWTQPQTIATLQGNTQVSGNMFATGDAHGHQVLSDTYVHATTDLQADGVLAVGGSGLSTIHGQLKVTNDLEAESTMHVGGILTAGAVNALTGNITTAVGDIVSKGEFNYFGADKARVTYCNMRLANSDANVGPGTNCSPTWFWAGNYWQSSGSFKIMFPLLLPPGSILTKVEVGYMRVTGAADDNFFLERESGFPDPSIGNPSGGTATVDTGTIDAWRNISITPTGGGVTIGDDERLTLAVVASVLGTRVSRVRLTWEEPGIRPVV